MRRLYGCIPAGFHCTQQRLCVGFVVQQRRAIGLVQRIVAFQLCERQLQAGPAILRRFFGLLEQDRPVFAAVRLVGEQRLHLLQKAVGVGVAL